MKHCTKLVLTALCMLTAIAGNGQKPTSSKPTLFDKYPATIACSATQLDNLFNALPGDMVKMELPAHLVLEGMLLKKQRRYNTIETISVQLPAFNKILFSVTRRFLPDHSVLYTAHLFNGEYADGYELKRLAGNTYQFVKIETGNLLPLCNQ